jgi:hypothetical protein
MAFACYLAAGELLGLLVAHAVFWRIVLGVLATGVFAAWEWRTPHNASVTFADELDGFVEVVRLKKPVPLPAPRVWHMTVAAGERDALRRKTDARNLNEWMRRSLVEYHERFRDRVLQALGTAEPRVVAIARNPRSFEGLVEIASAVSARAIAPQPSVVRSIPRRTALACLVVLRPKRR